MGYAVLGKRPRKGPKDLSYASRRADVLHDVVLWPPSGEKWRDYAGPVLRGGTPRRRRPSFGKRDSVSKKKPKKRIRSAHGGAIRSYSKRRLVGLECAYSRSTMIVRKEKSHGYQVSVPMPVLQELRMRSRGMFLPMQGEPSPVSLHVQMLR